VPRLPVGQQWGVQAGQLLNFQILRLNHMLNRILMKNFFWRFNGLGGLFSIVFFLIVGCVAYLFGIKGLDFFLVIFSGFCLFLILLLLIRGIITIFKSYKSKTPLWKSFYNHCCVCFDYCGLFHWKKHFFS